MHALTHAHTHTHTIDGLAGDLVNESTIVGDLSISLLLSSNVKLTLSFDALHTQQATPHNRLTIPLTGPVSRVLWEKLSWNGRKYSDHWRLLVSPKGWARANDFH